MSNRLFFIGFLVGTLCAGCGGLRKFPLSRDDAGDMGVGAVTGGTEAGVTAPDLGGGPCKVGLSCLPANPCHEGQIVCASGDARSCTDTQRSKSNGSVCGDGMVCRGGACVACMAGLPCVPSNPCHAGSTVCAPTLSCSDTDTGITNGTSCGSDKVCSGGDCNSCTVGIACQPTDPCKAGNTACSTGTATCVASGNKTNGTPCGTNMVCTNGSCVACVSGASCSPSNPCHKGTLSCEPGNAVCVDTGVPQPDGLSCGSDLVCRTGMCAPCIAGAPCQPANTCKIGTTVCDTGVSACVESGDKTPGTTCGNGLVCTAGNCAACNTGGICQPTNACHNGTLSCATGAAVCTDLGTSLIDGASCGTANDLFCKAGTCTSCSPGLVGCTTNPDPCKVGMTSCSTGSTVCVDGTDKPSGSSCGSNKVCNANNVCVDNLFTLTVTNASVGGASGSIASQSSPPATRQVACGATCAVSLSGGTSITLNATPGSGSYFGGWSGPCAGSGASCTFTLTTNLGITGTFTPANLVFVSPRTYTVGTLGGVAGADRACNQIATTAGKSGTFVAWISTTASGAVTRMGNARGWVRSDGKPFIDNITDLATYYPPELDVSGTEIGVDQNAAGGTGIATSFCGNWTSAVGSDLVVGDPSGGPEIWNASSGLPCSSSFYIYCFQKDFNATLTFPKANGRIAFLTDGGLDPSKGAQAADNLCTSEATAARLPGTYLAYLATTARTTASRFSFGTGTLPWVRPDGIQIVASPADLFTLGGKLLAPINVTPTLRYRGNWGAVTGVRDPALVAQSGDSCNNWSAGSASLLFVFGNPSRTKMQWVVGYGQDPCSNVNNSVYCLQE